ncbi:MAG: hypothetical protein HYV33_01115 [Candidatus Kerfeldbacteria bacterium]|nr:hypothetical protein [Candidatus Kerfeldbacteria bacterium]
MRDCLGWWQWLSVAVLAAGFGVISYATLDFYPSPDGVQLACAAQHLLTDGEFISNQTHGIYLNYAPCWTQSTYPVIQVVTAGLGWLLWGNTTLAVIVLAISLFVGTVIVVTGIVQRLFNTAWLSLVGGILAITSLGLVRSLVMTPHNLFGFLFLAIITLCLLPKKNHWPAVHWLGLAWLCTILLYSIHPLSFAVTAVALTGYSIAWTIVQKQWWWLGLASVVAYTVLSYVIKSWWPLDLLPYVQGINAPGVVKPWWDHLAIWGYGITPLAGFGLAWSMRQGWWQRIAFSIGLGLTAMIGGELHYFGIQLVPDRMIAFAWLPLLLFAMMALAYFIKQLPMITTMIMLCTISLAQLAHAGQFIRSDTDDIAKRFLPQPDFVEAISWLERYRTTDTFVLGVANIHNRQIQYAGLFYTGDIVAYPFSDMNHRDLLDFSARSVLLQNIIAQQVQPQYADLQGLYAVVTQPTSAAAQAYRAAKGITDALVWKNGPEYRLWKKIVPANHIIFENASYQIYSLTTL